MDTPISTIKTLPRQSLYWSFILWLKSPGGEVYWGFVIFLLAGLLALLQTEYYAYLVLLLGVALFKAWVEFSVSRLKLWLRLSHYKRVRTPIEFILKRADSVLRNNNADSLSWAIMLKDEISQNWYVGVSYLMTDAMASVSFPVNSTNWFRLIEKADAKPLILELATDTKRVVLVEPKSFQAFGDVTGAMLCPIYTPGNSTFSDSLLGIVAIYSTNPQSVLFQESERDRSLRDITRISRLLGQLLCYDCICP